MKPYLWSFFAILSLSIVGCRDDPYGSTESPSNGRSHTQQQTAALQIRVSDSRHAIQKRWRELSEHGTPEKIVDEFALDDLILEAPSLFPHHVDWEGLSLYSDRPFEPTAGVEILRNIRARLQYSPLFNPEQRHSAFICNDEWREKLYLSGADRYGGLNYYSKNRSVFLTGADVESNALLSPQDRPIAAPRTLTYYVAHEFTHSLVFEYLKTNGLPQLKSGSAKGIPIMWR